MSGEQVASAAKEPADADALSIIQDIEAAASAEEAEGVKGAPEELGAGDEAEAEKPEAEGEDKPEPAPTASRLIRWQDKLRKSAQKQRQEKQTFERERQAFATERAELEQLRAFRAKAKADPDAFLEEAGVSYDDVTTRRLKKGTPAEEIAALRRELEEIKNGTQKSREEATKAQTQQVRQAAEREFAQHVDANSYPGIESACDVYAPEKILHDAHAIADGLRAAGRPPTHAAVARALDAQYSKTFEQVTRRLGSGNAASANASSAQESEPGKQAKPGAPRAQSTLKSSQAGERSGTRKLSEEEEAAEMIALLEGRGTTAG